MEFRRQYRGFTPEAIENMRRRYEDTDEPQRLIAADYNIHRRTLDTLAKDQGWTLRKDRAQRDLPPDLRMLVAAENAVRAEVETSLTTSQAMSIADRLERAVDKELAAVELLRATLGSQPQLPADSERTARTLERLTDTMFKVRRLHLPDGQTCGSNDDLPRDIDEFRRALALRIETFVRSRTDGSLPERGESSGADTPP
jgi:hypothetical protein